MSRAADRRREPSLEAYQNRLAFDGEGFGLPTNGSLVVRDEPDLLVHAKRSKNADGKFTVGGYEVHGDGIHIRAGDPDRAGVAAVLVETFPADQLATDQRHHTATPIREGVPVVVAVDGRPAICAWLYARQGRDRGAIADAMGVGEPTVTEYLSRFRRRGVGIPDGLDCPPVGTLLDAVPPRFDPLVDDAGGRQQTVDGEVVG